jgi:hypothetical protein
VSCCKLRILLVFAAVAPLVFPAATAGEPIGPGDFAHGREIELSSAGPLQTLLLDLSVYRGTVEPQLADLRVFNAAGEAVPHAIRALARPRSMDSDVVKVPLFRLPRIGPGEPLSPGRNLSAGGGGRAYRIDAEVSADGAIVRLESGGAVAERAADADAAPDTAPPPDVPAAYLVDASQLRRPVVGLELALGQEPVEFVVPLRIEGSDDLVHFRSVGTQAALTRLDQAGHRIEISRVDFTASRYRYLKVSWLRTKLPVEIEAVRARLAPETELPPRDAARIPGRPVEEEVGMFLFDLGGEVPVDQVQVDLPDTNTLVEAQLFSGPSDSGPWVRHYTGLLYELEHSGLVRNPAIHWPVTRHRYFKLAVSSKGGGLGSGTPVMEIAWYPEQLLFITRGEGPFRLGYGRAAVASTRFDATGLISTTRTGSRELPRETASLGVEYPMAEPSVLELPEEPTSMRTIALWAVLVLSVCVVLAMSARLLRQMR